MNARRLALVEHANTQALPKYERRVERHRRAQDHLEDTCQMD
jgi:ribosomal protein S17